ncbi:transporter substrate-binding domain-containing protein [Dechloromonas sp. H13]|uniref:transglycosylase SLT domain-containing protein n=1 Tax=Dechloromonas sp. H13 TaxID=2570193 RepID=UPI0012916FF0|nr:transporter substrate-binding domain-containing protein [Dechloromonas sp. H13]
MASVRFLLSFLLLAWFSACALAASENGGSAAAAKAPPTKVRSLEIANKPWKGDFDAMLERRIIRVAVPYSRSLYFVDQGRERGLSAELIRDFERWVNKKHAKKLGKRPVTVYIVAATRDRLLPDLEAGLADIAVGNLTVTDERLAIVDFVAPDNEVLNTEILVTGPATPEIRTVDDLSGKTVHVRKTSSYHASLGALNERLRRAGKSEVRLVLVPEALEDEDMLEMMNAGLLSAIVVDDWKAKMWAQVLPKIVVREDIVLREPTRKGWAVRKGSPQLVAELNEFYVTWARKQGVLPYRQKQYMRTIKALNSAAAERDRQRFEVLIDVFEKYGARYNFDPLMLAAQGYQESTLDQSKKSHVGAIGIMQVMPTTGKSLNVGDIGVTEANIHAGAKYMDQLMTRYFTDAKFTEQNRTLFAFASYNAGPGNISRMRKEAAKRGLDPDKWFNNVEVVTAEKIGMETTTYVRNIFKYYVSYKLATDAEERAEQLKQKAGMQ